MELAPSCNHRRELNKIIRKEKEMDIKAVKAFQKRIPKGLSEESRAVIIRKYIRDKVDLTYALIEAIEIGVNQLREGK
jgi:hypothetical protein